MDVQGHKKNAQTKNKKLLIKFFKRETPEDYENLFQKLRKKFKPTCYSNLSEKRRKCKTTMINHGRNQRKKLEEA